MKAAVIVFPGSNCDHDALHCCSKVMGWDTMPVWHESTSLGGADLVFLPGGFSYGDYLRCGAIARFSPVMEAVKEHALQGGLTLGVCNGFQILIEAGMLPGALLQNSSLQFRCGWVNLRVESADSAFTRSANQGEVLRMKIAHGDGNYFASPELLKQLNDQKRIALRYVDAAGQTTEDANPNGSIENIAGVLNEGRNVLGMMPHPERACEDLMGGSDGKRVFESLSKAYADVGW